MSGRFVCFDPPCKLLCNSAAVRASPGFFTKASVPLVCATDGPACPQVGPPCLPLALGPLARAPALHTLSIAFDMRARGINPDQVIEVFCCAALQHIESWGLRADVVAMHPASC